MLRVAEPTGGTSHDREVSLAKVAETHARMTSGQARFRVVLTM